jgi:hypothetical protein
VVVAEESANGRALLALQSTEEHGGKRFVWGALRLLAERT